MSTAINKQDNKPGDVAPSDVEGSPPSLHYSISDSQGTLEGREVFVIYKDNFQAYKADLKPVIQNTFSKQTKRCLLFALAGMISILACVAIVFYLRMVVPATYIWPVGSKLLIALGVSTLFIGGLFSIGFAEQAFQKARSKISDIIDQKSDDIDDRIADIKEYKVDSDQLEEVILVALN